MPDSQGLAAYTSAKKLGKKYMAENSSNSVKGYLPVLEERLNGVEVAGEVGLGIVEIDLKRIIGTRTSSRSNAFAGNFMPIFAEESEFALKWQKLYMSQLEEGIREPIKVYEYINRYYVQEGNKRVSVMKFVGASSITADVVRLIPKRDESSLEISIYYEFLDFDMHVHFDNLWFSKRGGFTKLVEHTRRYIERNPKYASEGVGEVIKRAHRIFRSAYRVAMPTNRPLTSGDALVEYINIFGFPLESTQSEIVRNLRRASPQFIAAAKRQVGDSVEEHVAEPSHRSLQTLLFGRRKLRVAFAFEGSAESDLLTRQHFIAYLRVARKYKENAEFSYVDGISDDKREGYEKLRGLVDEHRPELLFTTSPIMSDISLRIALEFPEMIVLNCDRPQVGRELNTYFWKLHDATFLCGLLAGSATRSGAIGYTSTNMYNGRNMMYNVDAFALGASMVNPHVRVLDVNLDSLDDISGTERVCELMKGHGADVVYCRYSAANPLERKAFADIFAQLYLLDQSRGFGDCIGAAALDWSAFYGHMVGDALEERLGMLKSVSGGAPLHFGWGINAGMVDAYGVEPLLGSGVMRLLGVFRSLIRRSSLYPFTGPIFDNEGTLRFEKDYKPTLREIQCIDWYEKSVVPLELPKN